MNPAFGKIRSVSLPITVASIAVVLSIGLIVAWLVVLTSREGLGEHEAEILVLGILSPALLLGVFATFSVFLVRRILEVNRQNRFIDSVTHELKSPLASMQLCVNTLVREGLAAEQHAMLCGMIRDDIERLSAFIDDILASTRLVHRQTTHAIDDVDVAELLRSCIARVTTRSGVSADVITFSHDQPVTLSTDRTALATVVTNLIDNAVKYSPPERLRVDVRLEIVGDRVVISVKDQGIGIAANRLRSIFRRFYRVTDENVRARRGTGLGLYVVEQLTRTLGGTVDAASPGPGEGATFTLRLPLHEKRRRRSVVEVIEG